MPCGSSLRFPVHHGWFPICLVGNCPMHENDLKAIPELRELPVFEEGDSFAQMIASRAEALEIAEVDDPVRLHDMLHRDEYQPVGAVRYRRHDRERICVYLARMDHT